MSYHVELLDRQGNPVAGPADLLTVAEPFLSSLPQKAMPDAHCLVRLLMVPGEDSDLPGEPYLTYRSIDIGWAYVVIDTPERNLYRHSHTVGEVLGQGLRDWIKKLADGTRVAAYRLTGPGLEALANRATPAVEGVTDVKPYAEGERPAFRIRPLPPPEPPSASLASLGAQVPSGQWQEPERTDFVKVLVEEGVHDELCTSRQFSDQVEEGGFLVGNVFADEEHPGTYIAQVTGALAAHKTGASLLHFTFTGDSFDHVNQVLERERPGERILGWYHTHLFPATNDLGFSTIDIRLHFTTFRIPWQIAGLVNIARGQRVLRFYVRRHDTMALCPHQAVAIERAGETRP